MVTFLEGSLIALWVCQMSDVTSKADFQVDIHNDCVRWTPKSAHVHGSRRTILGGERQKGHTIPARVVIWPNS